MGTIAEELHMRRLLFPDIMKTPAFAGKTGLAPGTPVFVGERKLDRPRIDIVAYDQETVEEVADAGLDDCVRYRDLPHVTWINVTGIHDVKLIEALGERFQIHPLTLEDLVNTSQRPKVEEYDTYVFMVLKMISYNRDLRHIEVEHLSLILGHGYVLLFQEREGDVFESVRERIRTGKGRLRRSKADYLAYALMDAVIDAYFVALDMIGEHVEEVDQAILAAPNASHLHTLYRTKREILYLRKVVWPLREEVAALSRYESTLISDQMRIFLRDLYDHTIQAIDMIETFRDLLAGMHDTYLSTVSNRMNEVMKVLTMIATIFIPLSFIAGVYGMNFEYMPELEWRWGYYVVLAIMAVIGVSMLAFFKARRWF